MRSIAGTKTQVTATVRKSLPRLQWVQYPSLPAPPLPPANPPCKPPTRLVVRHVFFLCMHDCVCIFACMPRDASIQERVGQHTHTRCGFATT